MSALDKFNELNQTIGKTEYKVGGSKTKDFSAVDYFLTYNNPEAKNKLRTYYASRELEKEKLIREGLNRGMSWESISSQSGLPIEQVQAYSEKTKPGYGTTKSPSIGDRVKDVGKAITSSYDRVGTSIGTAIGYNSSDAKSAREAQQRSMDMDREIIAKAGKQLKDPNVPEEKKVKIRELIKRIGGDNAIYNQSQEQSQQIQEQLDPLKNVAAIANVGMDIATLGTVGGATKAANLGRQVATGAAQGAAAGAFGAVEQNGKDTSLKDIATGAAVGGALGGGLTAGVGKFSQWLGDRQAAKVAAREALQTAQLNSPIDQAALKAINAMDAEDAFMKSQGITNPARLLPDGTQSKAARIAEIDNELNLIRKGQIAAPKNTAQTFAPLEQTAETKIGQLMNKANETPLKKGYVRLYQTNDAVDQISSDFFKDSNKLTNYINNRSDSARLRFVDVPEKDVVSVPGKPDVFNIAPEAKIKSVEVDPSVVKQMPADSVRALAKERMQLEKEIDAIKNPVVRQAEEINLVDSKLQQAVRSGNRTEAVKLQKEYDVLVEQGNQLDKQIESQDLLSGKTKSNAAARTEADAIENNLTQGFGEDVTGYVKESGFLKNQGLQTVQLMDQDYDLAKRIAMGEAQPPSGLQASSVYEGVKTRAIKEGDTELIRRLATESKVPTMGTKAGRFNAAFAYRDPENPVTALQDLVKARKASKLNIPATVTKEETEQITSLAAEVARTKSLVETGKLDRLEYGKAHVAYMKYVEGLKEAANKKTVKEMLSHPVDTAVSLAGVTKSLRATLDNSALFRQGLKTLTTHPGTWLKNASQSFVDIAKTLGGKEVMDFVDADIVSRQNALNGLYKKMGLDVAGGKGKIVEEAFPGIAQEKIPGIGRFFKASDVAYTAFLQRTRADLADKYLDYAVKAGVDITDKKQIESIGKLVNSLTSRGDLGRLEGSARVLNNVFFSPRLVKANMDILTAHQFQRGVTPFVRKRAALNLLKMVASVGAVLTVANEVRPGSVEWDPRSSDFGKIKVGNTRFDVAGGMAGFVTLGSRLATTSSKSSSTGEVTDLNTGDFGSKTSADVLLDFTQNKFSPAAGVIRDYLRGKNFSGEKPTVGSTLNDLFMPLIVDNYRETKKDPNSANTLVALIADGLGIGTNTYGVSNNWKANTSRELEGFKQKVGEKKFTEANDKFNQQYADWFTQIRQDDAFWKLAQEDRKNYLTLNKDRIKKEVLMQYGYEYKKTKRSDETQNIINELDKYKK